MQYYRCKCGSDFAQGPEGHNDPEPHEYVTRYESHSGQPYEICRVCMRKRAAIEGAPEPADPYLGLVQQSKRA